MEYSAVMTEDARGFIASQQHEEEKDLRLAEMEKAHGK